MSTQDYNLNLFQQKHFRDILGFWLREVVSLHCAWTLVYCSSLTVSCSPIPENLKGLPVSVWYFMNGGTPVVWIFKVKSFSLLLLFRVLLNKTEKLSCLLLIRTKHANIIYRLYRMSPLTALLKFIQNNTYWKQTFYYYYWFVLTTIFINLP